MSILLKIADYKKEEIRKNQELYPVKLLEKSLYYEAPTVSLKKYLKRDDKLGIIAEIKRKSPSRGIINNHVSIERTSIGYMQAGASALSVLTDSHFFGGSNKDLSEARKFNFCPILRKDFILDEYQIIEARSIGADAILLIAAMLKPDHLLRLAKFAHSLGLEVLLEVINREEIDANASEFVDVIGVNNRNLTDFTLNINTSFDLLPHIPSSFTKITESAISTPMDVVNLKRAGFDGFLIGENFMKHSRPEKACSEFIRDVYELLEKPDIQQ